MTSKVIRTDGQLHILSGLLAGVARKIVSLNIPFLPRKWSVYGWTIVATLIGLTLGMNLATSWQAADPKPAVRSEGSRQVVAETILRLEGEQADLKKQISQLRDQLANQQNDTARTKSTLSEISEEVESQKMAAGMNALSGPGLRVTIDDSASKTIPSGDDPSWYIVHEFHLRDIVNALWQSGAEAVCINGERMVGATSIYCVGSTIMVNSTRLSPPYEITAIGDPAAMDEWINNPNDLKDLKTRIKNYGLQFKTVRSHNLAVPAYSGSSTIKYATLGIDK